jgi:steroid delta-isomerase-like uncharacterized protein
MNSLITAQQLTEKLNQAFASGDPAAVAALYTEDAIYYDNAEVIRGREAIAENYAGILQAFPDVQSEFWSMMTCGKTFIYQLTWRGTHTGPLATPEGDIAPTGNKIEMQAAFFAKMSPDGLIREDRSYYDSAQMMRQLGLG